MRDMQVQPFEVYYIVATCTSTGPHIVLISYSLAPSNALVCQCSAFSLMYHMAEIFEG